MLVNTMIEQIKNSEELKRMESFDIPVVIGDPDIYGRCTVYICGYHIKDMHTWDMFCAGFRLGVSSAKLKRAI